MWHKTTYYKCNPLDKSNNALKLPCWYYYLFYVLSQRHKLPKNQFVPSSLKNVSVTGVFGQKVHIQNNIPLQCLNIIIFLLNISSRNTVLIFRHVFVKFQCLINFCFTGTYIVLYSEPIFLLATRNNLPRTLHWSKRFSGGFCISCCFLNPFPSKFFLLNFLKR